MIYKITSLKLDWTTRPHPLPQIKTVMNSSHTES